MTKDKMILKKHFAGDSARTIASKLGISRNTVAKVLEALVKNPLTLTDLDIMDNTDVHNFLFPKESKTKTELELPDFEYLHIEMLKPGVSLTLLWEEYNDECRATKKEPYKYSQFCKLYKDYLNGHNYTMNIKHKPGEKLMVDWMGTTMPLYDKEGKKKKCYIFVATLPYSMYTFAKACESMNEENWIRAHVEMYEFFGGSTRILVPDNLKTGVIKHRKHEDPVLNKTYQELAEHYKTAILPTRIRAPKDKAAVEGAVGNLTTHIVAKLRNYHFTSIELMNLSIRDALNQWNNREFQKRNGSRWSIFRDEEVIFLNPLPKTPFDYAIWKKSTVNFNYHIQVLNNYYSVPYTYVKKQVEVRVGANTIEIFYDGNRISSHKRLYSSKGQYSTNKEHMPPNHVAYDTWDATRFRQWAKKIGESCFEVIDRIIKSYAIPEQSFNSCMSVLKLSEKFGNEKLEEACADALVEFETPKYANIKSFLARGKRKEPPKSLGLLRGADYYGGK